jgi:hypothetical protein
VTASVTALPAAPATRARTAAPAARRIHGAPVPGAFFPRGGAGPSSGDGGSGHTKLG